MKNLSLILLSCLFFSISCKKQDNKEPIPIIFNNSGSIDSKGGIIKTSDGASVDIPPNALTSSQNISMTNVTPSQQTINTGTLIYEMKPDGLVFNDSVSLIFPFDNKYIDINSNDENKGVSIKVFQNYEWKLLKSKIDLKSNTIKAKTTHFSLYSISNPNIYADYFRQNINSPAVYYYVPYYYQGTASWCAFYSISMITKYSGYNYKAPFFAALENKSPSIGLNYEELSTTFDSNLSKYSINTEIAPMWLNNENLCGYILQQLNMGKPVYLGANSIDHAIVIVGHDSNCFYINDPSGTMVHSIYPDNGFKLGMVDIPYQKFNDVLNLGTFFGSAASTLVVTSEKTPNIKFAGSLNFIPGGSAIILDKDKNQIGMLLINGELYHPNGFSFSVPGIGENYFDGSYYLEAFPLISNNDSKNDLIADLHYKIDGIDVTGSPIVLDPIIKGNNFYYPDKFTFQLKNLKKGQHLLSIQLVSRNDTLQHDSWEFPFEIFNEFIDETITDIDGNSYKTVKIGTQTWMAENLKTTKYRNGDKIQNVNVTDNANWAALTTGAYCSYNEATYVLYNGWAVFDSRKIAPVGWHIPNEDEWTTLITFLGGESVAGGAIKEAGTTHWISPNTGATNSSGFTSLPNGFRDDQGSMEPLGYVDGWWSSEHTTDSAWTLFVDNDESRVIRLSSGKWSGISVRCIKD